MGRVRPIGSGWERARQKYSAPSTANPITVLQCTVYCVQLSCAPTCRSAGNRTIEGSFASLRMTSRAKRGASLHELVEEEHERHQGAGRDDQRSDEEGAEQLVVVLEMHVEHDDDGELHRRH